MKIIKLAVLTALLAPAATAQTSHHQQKKPDWNFAVSGDSRNCGDVVMPSIAAGAVKNQAAFYWHLGDLRAIYGVDQDYQNSPEHRGKTIQKDEYLKDAWDDFIQHQLGAFGSMPVFVGIGNHETTPPKTREEFASKFAQWLDSATLKTQRLADDPQATAVTTYFHWIQGGVDFIYLDNATHDQFSPEQVIWLEGVLKRASANPEVHALVVGMHAALPDSVAFGHSMSDWPRGIESGRRVYSDLLNLKKKTGKNVYLLASHSHFFIDGIFNSEYLAAHGRELPGWIVGTAGAVRYALPPDAARAKEARTKIYGYLLGTVHQDGKIDFKFEEIKKSDTPAAISQRYTPQFVDFCFDKNTAFNEVAEPRHK
ncbi:MAG: hypothetical protein WCG81_12590 [Candidatus Angelobacter sp.]